MNKETYQKVCDTKSDDTETCDEICKGMETNRGVRSEHMNGECGGRE